MKGPPVLTARHIAVLELAVDRAQDWDGALSHDELAMYDAWIDECRVAITQLKRVKKFLRDVNREMLASSLTAAQVATTKREKRHGKSS